MDDENENFTDEVIEGFLEEMEPVCSITLNQHSLDILNNMAFLSIVTQSLLHALKNDDDDGIEAAVSALRMAYPHSPACYVEVVERLEGIWRTIFDEEYVEHLFGEDDPDDD